MNNINLKLTYEQSNRYARMKMSFSNGGEVTVPGKSGGYVVASGCGSGKTTIIRKAILEMWRTGVLYSAATIKECNEMYDWLINNGINKNMIAVLHSDYDDPGVRSDLLKSDVDALKDIPILICTHYKLLHEHNEVLFSYNGQYLMTRSDVMLSRSHLAVIKHHKSHKIGDVESDNEYYNSCIYPRANVFIDEVPTCESIGVELNKLNLNAFTVQDYTITKKQVLEKNPVTGKLELVIKDCITLIPNSKKAVNDYNSFNRLIDEYKSQLGFYKEDSQSNKMKNIILSDLIYDNLPAMINSNYDKFKLTRTIADMLYDDSDFRIILFEGTGDLTFYDSNLFDILSVESKYSSPVYVRNPIPFNIKRSYRNQKEFNNSKDEIEKSWNDTLDIVAEILRSDEVDRDGNVVPCTGTLIQTWKGYSIKESDSNDYTCAKMTERLESYNPDFHLPTKVRYELNRRGIVSGFEVIHFMSGLDKATNEFRDFNRIIILGDLQVPNSVVNKFNQDYRVNTTPALFRTYQLSQLVCRTCIRKNEGKPIFIYYTDDIDQKVIDRLVGYITNNLTPKELVDASISGDELDSIGIKPKWKPVVELFCSLDPEFKRCILNRLPYNIDISLDDIYKLIPMYEKKAKYYNPLVNYLKKLGIRIEIKSEIGRNRYSK